MRLKRPAASTERIVHGRSKRCLSNPSHISEHAHSPMRASCKTTKACTAVAVRARKELHSIGNVTCSGGASTVQSIASTIGGIQLHFGR